MNKSCKKVHKTQKWKCQVKLADNIIMEENFITLKDIAKKLGVSYARVSEAAPKGRNKKRLNNSPYFTDLIITPLSKSNEIDNNMSLE